MMMIYSRCLLCVCLPYSMVMYILFSPLFYSARSSLCHWMKACLNPVLSPDGKPQSLPSPLPLAFPSHWTSSSPSHRQNVADHSKSKVCPRQCHTCMSWGGGGDVVLFKQTRGLYNDYFNLSLRICREELYTNALIVQLIFLI